MGTSRVKSIHNIINIVDINVKQTFKVSKYVKKFPIETQYSPFVRENCMFIDSGSMDTNIHAGKSLGFTNYNATTSIFSHENLLKHCIPMTKSYHIKKTHIILSLL